VDEIRKLIPTVQWTVGGDGLTEPNLYFQFLKGIENVNESRHSDQNGKFLRKLAVFLFVKVIGKYGISKALILG